MGGGWGLKGEGARTLALCQPVSFEEEDCDPVGWSSCPITGNLIGPLFRCLITFFSLFKEKNNSREGKDFNFELDNRCELDYKTFRVSLFRF